MNAENAQTIALQALAWVVSSDEHRPIFLGSTGGSEDDLRTRVAEPEFLGAVLDFITMDDSWVTAFCDSVGLAYDQPMRARYALPGAQDMHWT